MLSARSLCLCAFTLAFVPSFAPPEAWAETPPAATSEAASDARRRVEEELIKPLAEKDKQRPKFTRARPPPAERRVRVTAAAPSSDKAGHAFMPFAIDVRYGDTWTENDIVGCTYAKAGTVFVKSGDEYRPAGILLGKSAAPVPDVCVAAKSA